MNLVVRGRRGGKTTVMINWLLGGHQIPDYPGWTRVIVCATNDDVVRVTDLVREATQELEGVLPPRALGDLRKAVWGPNDVKTGLRGGYQVQVGVDNADTLLEQFLGTRITKASLTDEAH